MVLVTPGFPVSLDDHHKPFLADHARALAAAGADVTVVCPAHPNAPRRTDVGGIEVHRVRFAPASVEARVAHGESYRVFAGLSALWVIPMICSLALAVVRQARRRGARPRAESVIIHGHWWFPCGLVAVAAARMAEVGTTGLGGARRQGAGLRGARQRGAGLRAASVVHIHGSDAAVTTNAVHRWLARRVLCSADAVVAVSDDLCNWAAQLMQRRVESAQQLRIWSRARLRAKLRATLPAARTLLRVISMPIGADRLGVATPMSTEPMSTDGPVLGVGRLMSEKGFDVLIEAVALMPPAERPEVVIVGEGPERVRLKALALRRGVSLELPGAIAPTKIGSWYRRSRLVCVPSRREGFGMVTAEALATGRPVVATAVGAAARFIAEGVNGFLVPANDISALAKGLARALRSGELLVVASRADAVASHNPQAHAAALLEIYADITATP